MVIPRDRPSGPFSGTSFKTTYTSPRNPTDFFESLLSTDKNRFMYADDHQLFSVAKTANEAESILTKEGNNTSEWYNNNLLQGNFFKYQVMSLGPSNWHKDLHIVINDTVIDQKPEITLLGVTLDDQLSFSSHVSNVRRKASPQTGVLLRLRNLIRTSAKLLIVKFAVISHLTYCQTVWHFCRSADARKLERIQERALRAVYHVVVYRNSIFTDDVVADKVNKRRIKRRT